MTQLAEIGLIILGSLGVIAWEVWGVWIEGQATDLRRDGAWK